ncbi:MAG: hypothetical protein LW823_08445 [Rickettsiales bacterium]|jgi:hypothetical protein|nr:hypothetical protein [Rickettsiales bacterium]
MEEEKPTSKLAGLKKQSLKIAGFSYLAGDAALAIAKHQEGDKHGLGGAAIWAAGGLAAATFGNPSAEKQLCFLEERLGQYLRKQSVAIPRNPTTEELTKQHGIIHHIQSFLYANPSELLNSFYALGGAMTLVGGIKKHNKMDVASGILVTAGALAGLLIQEKQPDADHPASGMLGKLWESAQQKPLRVSGALYLANNVPLFAEAYRKHKQGNKSYVARYLTAASYVFANSLLAISSRDSSGAGDDGKEAILSALAETAASVINAQPREVQEALIHNVSGFISSQPEIKKSAADIAKLLHQKLDEAHIVSGKPASWSQRLEITPPSAPMATR